MTARSPAKKRSPLSIVLGLLAVLAVTVAQQAGWISSDAAPTSSSAGGTATATRSSGTEEILELFRAQRSGVMLTVETEVVKRLPDDDDGSRHQRFLVEVAPDHTVLVAHNIDLAPRVPLAEGDTVRIHGQYEWNEKGGVLHWTHHDPRKRHEEGWIEHAGQRYE